MYQELVKFIETCEKSGYDYIHGIVDPGAFEFAETNGFLEFMHLEFIGLKCDCNCSGTPHEHGIFRTKTPSDEWKNARLRWKRSLEKKKVMIPKKFKFTRGQNKSHTMNMILYVAGPDSRNYNYGFSFIKKDKHTNHVHPFSSLPTSADIMKAKNTLIDKDPEKQEELAEWRAKMAKKKAQFNEKKVK